MYISQNIAKWQENFLARLKLPHWLYISADEHKILTHFLGSEDCTKCTINELSMALEIPVRTLYRKLNLLKELGLISSGRTPQENLKSTSDCAEYIVHEASLVLLDSLLISIDVKNISNSSPWRKMLKSKRELKNIQQTYNLETCCYSFNNQTITHILGITAYNPQDSYNMPNLNATDFGDMTAYNPQDSYNMPNLNATNSDELGENKTAYNPQDSYNMPNLNELGKSCNSLGLASRARRRACVRACACAYKYIYIYAFLSLSISRRDISNSRKAGLHEKFFSNTIFDNFSKKNKSKISNQVKSINLQNKFFEMKRTKFPKMENFKFDTPEMKRSKFNTPDLEKFSGVSDSAASGSASPARTTPLEPISGTKGDSMLHCLGLIKNAPQNGAERKTRLKVVKKDSSSKKNQVSFAECEKFVDYWNGLASDFSLPKIMKVRGGTPTKGYQTALRFFHELKTGSLLTGKSKTFYFTPEYLASTTIPQLSKDGYLDNDIFRMVKIVAEKYSSLKYPPTSFSKLAYNKFGTAAEKFGGGVSRFLEIISAEVEDDRLGQELEVEINEKLTDEEYRVLLDILCDLYHRIRKDDKSLDDLPDFELSALLSGMKYLRKIYTIYYPKLVKSYEIRTRDIDPTFFWFVQTYADMVEIPDWRDMPMALLFNRSKKYLGSFLSKLEEML